MRSSYLNEAKNLASAGLGTIATYNLAAVVCSLGDFSSDMEKGLTAGLTTAGTILGYKARDYLKTGIVKNVKRRLKRAKARKKLLVELVKEENEDFLGRQGIKKGEFGPVRKGLKYLMTVPAGGVLGYTPGFVGFIPLCFYFGQHYSWSKDASLMSGAWTGAAVGAYAFGELVHKGKNTRLVTGASALLGAGLYHFTTGSDLSTGNPQVDILLNLGLAGLSATATGKIGNMTYKNLKRIFQQEHDQKLLEDSLQEIGFEEDKFRKSLIAKHNLKKKLVSATSSISSAAALAWTTAVITGEIPHDTSMIQAGSLAISSLWLSNLPAGILYSRSKDRLDKAVRAADINKKFKNNGLWPKKDNLGIDLTHDSLIS